MLQAQTPSAARASSSLRFFATAALHPRVALYRSSVSSSSALWAAYRKHYGHDGPVLVGKASSRQMNPSMPQAFIDAEYEKDPVSAEAEFGAKGNR